MESHLEEGKVIGIKDGKALVGVSASDPARCRRCGFCVEAARTEGGGRVMELPLEAGIQVGETVLLESRQPSAQLSAAALFGLPTLLVGGLAISGALWAPRLGVPDWAGALGGFLSGVALSILCARGLERGWKARGAFRPRIVRKGS